MRKENKPRFLIPWNTGQRVFKPKKGKGSYSRRIKNYSSCNIPVE